MEPITGAVVAAGKVAKAADESGLVKRLVGPLFDEVGTSWADGYRRRNAEKVARKAARQVGADALALPGAVHPRVAHRILDDGSFVHEDVMQEYLAGLLAGSRTESGEDDRAAYYVDLVASLPSIQVKLHHAIYAALATTDATEGFGTEKMLRQNTIITPPDVAAACIGVPADLDAENVTAEALLDLHREGLVSSYGLGSESDLGLGSGDKRLLVAVPSTVGCFLALWAHGFRDADIDGMSRTLPCNFEEPGPEFSEFTLQPYRI